MSLFPHALDQARQPPAKAVVDANPHSRVLILTYSKRLQKDTEDGLKGNERVDVFTFHAFAGEFFQDTDKVNNDHRLRTLRARAAPPLLVSPYEFIILDEVQDMTGILYWLTCMLMSSLRSFPKPPKLLLLGDPRQAIYGYQGADARYLQFGQELLSDYNPYPWQNLDLAKSFRLSHENAAFVNTFVGDEYIEGSHHGPQPIYIYSKPYHKPLAEVIYKIIKGYPPEDCAIIAPSVRRNAPLAELTSELSEKFLVPVAEPPFDDSPLNGKVLQGKLTTATYHQFKGLGRKVVIVLEPPLPFLQWDKTMKACRFIKKGIVGPGPQHNPEVKPPNNSSPLAVTDLLRYVPSETLEQLIEQCVDCNELKGRSPPIKIPGTVSTNYLKKWHESVGDPTGTAVTAAFEHKVSGACSLFRGDYEENTPILIPEEPEQQWFAREAARHSAWLSGYRSRLGQLNKSNAYRWLRKHLPKTSARLACQFKDTSLLTFEQSVHGWIKDENYSTSFKSTEIRGQIDIMERSPVEGEPPTIWEIKVVASLSMEHIAQVVLYGLLWYKQSADSQKGLKFPRLILFNVRDGTKWEISTTLEKATTFAEKVLGARNTNDKGVSDEDFLEGCRKTREEVAGVANGVITPNNA